MMGNFLGAYISAFIFNFIWSTVLFNDIYTTRFLPYFNQNCASFMKGCKEIYVSDGYVPISDMAFLWHYENAVNATGADWFYWMVVVFCFSGPFVIALASAVTFPYFKEYGLVCGLFLHLIQRFWDMTKIAIICTIVPYLVGHAVYFGEGIIESPYFTWLTDLGIYMLIYGLGFIFLVILYAAVFIGLAVWLFWTHMNRINHCGMNWDAA